MKLHVQWTSLAKKQLYSLDKPFAALILGWVRSHLEHCTDPYFHGSYLSPDDDTAWKYRIGIGGEYRLLARIQHDTILLLQLCIGHSLENHE